MHTIRGGASAPSAAERRSRDPILMTWTKFGAEFNSECALGGLSDASYRTHCEAIGWLYEVEDLTCRIPKRLLRRFASSEDTDAAIEQLTTIGYWKDAGAVWVVLHHATVVRQSIAAQQDKRSRDAKAQAKYRRKVSADVSADVNTESAATQSDRQTVGLKDHGALENQDQDHEAGQGSVGGEADDKEGPGPNHSAANSQKPRVHNGSDSPSSDVQQIPIPVTRQSPAADRNAREHPASGAAGIVIIECRNPDNAPLAELARHVAVQHPQRTPERRAAAHLRASLITTSSPQAARRALATFGGAQAQADAASLLHRLSLELCTLLCGSAPGSCTEVAP